MSHPDEPEDDERILPPDREDDDDDGVPSVDQIIGTFMTEASLWPVLIVMLGALGAFGGTILVLAGLDRNPFAAAALVLLLGMTLDVAIRSRRDVGLRNLARLIGLLWLVAAGFAGLGLWTGVAY